MMNDVLKTGKSSNFASETNSEPVMIVVESKRKKLETLKKEYPNAMIIDVTSHAQDEFIEFSPFYPHGGIPVPFTDGMVATSVEGIWQGLKVFENADVDTSLFYNSDMKNLKRTVRRFGQCLGHRRGVHGEELFDYLTARKLIYLPSYKWVLEHNLQKLVKAVRIISKNKPVVLLNYNTNPDVNDPKKPLSHASLIKAYIEGNYPEYIETERLKSEELYEKILERERICDDVIDFIEKNKNKLLEEICFYCHLDPIDNDVYIFYDGSVTCKIGNRTHDIELINGAWEVSRPWGRERDDQTLEK